MGRSGHKMKVTVQRAALQWWEKKKLMSDPRGVEQKRKSAMASFAQPSTRCGKPNLNTNTHEDARWGVESPSWAIFPCARVDMPSNVGYGVPCIIDLDQQTASVSHRRSSHVGMLFAQAKLARRGVRLWKCFVLLSRR